MALRTYFMAEMAWPEVQEYLSEHDLALWPIGSTEQHGRHAGLGVDSYIALELARRVAPRVHALIAPVLQFGLSAPHARFAGTLALSPATFSAVVDEVLDGLIRHGFRKVFIINGSRAHDYALAGAAGRIRRAHDAFCAVATVETIARAALPATSWQSNELAVGDLHAGDLETSMALAARPTAVDMSAARPERPEQLIMPNAAVSITDPLGLTFDGWTMLSALTVEEYAPFTGVVGDPRRASVAKGETAFAEAETRLTRLIEAVRVGYAVSPKAAD